MDLREASPGLLEEPSGYNKAAVDVKHTMDFRDGFEADFSGICGGFSGDFRGIPKWIIAPPRAHALLRFVNYIRWLLIL